MACGCEGPATSWLALSLQLEGKLKALEVSASYEELAVLAEGPIREIVSPISQAASRGALVRLVGAERAPPNPSINRTCPGKPGHAGYLQR